MSVRTGEEIVKKDRGFCPICGGLYVLRADGTVGRHDQRVVHGNFQRVTYEECPGSLARPETLWMG